MQPSNLIIISSDQHSRRMLGCYGNPYVRTPNLDRLAQNGVVFQNAYCNSPICVPSRASFAIGDYASRHRYWDNAHAYAGEVKSWGSRLTGEGFPVTTIGKLHYKDASPATGFPDQRIPLHIKNGVGDVYGSIRDKVIDRPQFREAIDSACAGSSDYQRYDIEIAKQAAAFLKEHPKDATKPFTLYVNFVTPHFPLVAPKEYLDLYPDSAGVQKPIQFEKELWPDHPAINDYRRYCGTENLDEETAWNAIRTYYALCSFLDAQVGVVLNALAETGLEANTRIIYTSDHGDTMGDHGCYFKSTMYEGSAGVPLIISGPGIPKGAQQGTNVSLVDIYPSVLECVGITPDEYDRSLPGAPLWPYAQGTEDPERSVFCEYYAQGAYTATFMLRKGRYKYVYYVGERPQLFDLESDPLELSDLAENAEYRDVLQALERELRCVADPEALEAESKQAQQTLLEAHGGREEFLRTFRPSLFSPIPKL